MRSARISLLLIVLALLMAASASAKFEPYVEDAEDEWGGVGDKEAAAWQAPSALPFYGLYGHLTEGDVDAFVYRFEDVATAFSIQVIVPVCGGHFTDFYPSVALIGPGLVTDLPEDVELPFELPEGAGVQLFVEQEKPENRVIDRSSGYVRRGYVSTWWSVDIPESGEYIIAVWEPNDHEGAYALATGREHPEMRVSDEREPERIRIFNMIERDTWIGVDCRAS